MQKTKSMIVIDTPEHCYFCKMNQMGFTHWCGVTQHEATHYGFPDDCPLQKYEESIPVEWINKYIDSTLDEDNSQMLGFKAAIIKEMIEEWLKENEISVMPVSDNSTIPLDYLGERK